ncbi:MAG: prolyl-tRNA synthetase associated domain-containing protein [Oscillibacter sp.]|jgi:Ala-tRNA(Pro) deacylase|nr:prolyl-tRNA synthetase associated domain-containing protein [Oscillibacter sp.]
MTISEIYTTAPAAASCEAAARTFALLDELGIPYTRVEHDAADTMEDCAAISDVLGSRICKNLVLCNRQKTDFYLLAMPEDKPFLTKDLSHQIGSSRLSFAPGELMEELIGCTPGSASVLGLMNDTEHRVRLLMDKDTYEAEWFGCHPCKNDGSLRIQTRDLLHKFLPYTGHEVTVVEL